MHECLCDCVLVFLDVVTCLLFSCANVIVLLAFFSLSLYLWFDLVVLILCLRRFGGAVVDLLSLAFLVIVDYLCCFEFIVVF